MGSDSVAERRLVAGLFLLFGLLTSLFLAWNMPPYQPADELSHTLRADMTLFGRVVGERIPTPGGPRAGGPVHQGLLSAEGPFDDIAFHPDHKADRADYAAAGAAHWGEGVSTVAFPDAAANSPLLYLPQTVGLGLAQGLRLAPVQALYLARLASVLACVLIGAAALLLAGRIRFLLFTIMLLPMSSALFGSVTADGLFIALAALAAAVLSRAMAAGRPLEDRELGLVAVCLLLLGLAKAPYALLAVALAWIPTHKRRRGAAAAAGVLAVSFAWSSFTGAVVQTPIGRDGPVSDTAAKLAFLFKDAATAPTIAWKTLTESGPFYFRSFVGVLGALDTPLPGAYYVTALVVMLAAAVLTASIGSPGWGRFKVAAVAGALAAAAVTFGAMYLLWTPLGAMGVEGMQGRYFLPLAIFAALALEGERPLVGATWTRRPRLAAMALVLGFPLLSHLVIERTVILRYFLD